MPSTSLQKCNALACGILWRSYSIRHGLSTFSVDLYIQRFHRGPCKIVFEVIFAISEPILTKFGTRIWHENPQLYVAQIFDIAPLTDFWAIFQKNALWVLANFFPMLLFFVKFTYVVANYITDICCEFKKIDEWEITLK